MPILQDDMIEFIEDNFDFVFYLNTKKEQYFATNDLEEARHYAHTFKHSIYMTVILGIDIYLRRQFGFTSRERFDRFMSQFDFDDEKGVYHLVWFLIGGFHRIPED
jgi:hypothetical protein